MRTRSTGLLVNVAVFLVVFTCIYTGQLIAQTTNTENRETEFKLKKAYISESERRNIIDRRIYESKSGEIIKFEAEFFRIHPEEISTSFDQLRRQWKSCNDLEDVLNVNDLKVGKRVVCEHEKDEEKYAVIIFSYDAILTVISGSPVEELLKFESQLCVRSKLIPGVPCKY